MRIFMMKITLRAEWVHSLKEKRMIVLSLTQRLKNKFNISVCEAENQDIHQNIVIGIVGVTTSDTISDASMEKIIDFIEENTDAELIDIQSDKDIF